MKVFLISLLLFLCVGCSSNSGKIEYSASCKRYDFYDYKNEVPETEMVDDSFFDDVFIGGDSRVGSFVLYNQLSNATLVYIDSLSLNMIDITTHKDLNDTLHNLMMNTEKNNLYLFIGINEIGMGNFDKWAIKLDEFVKELKTTEKNIYLIQSYTIHHAYGTPHEKVKDKVIMVNEKIKEVAENNFVYYLNPDPYLVGEDGYVFKDYVYDGIHFTKLGSEIFKDFLKSHVAGEKYVKEICN